LDPGRLVQQGRHEELLAEGGLYKHLHDLQFGLAQAPADGHRRSDRGGQGTVLVLMGNLFVVAVDALLREGSADELRVLVDNFPDGVRTGAIWPLIGAVLAALRDDTDVP